MPTAPPAPVRFTTTIGCLSVFSICEASGRPTMSATPPGGNGTTMVIGLAGYASCAWAVEMHSSAVKPAAIVLMDASSCGGTYRMLQMLHFLGSLPALWGVKCTGTQL